MHASWTVACPHSSCTYLVCLQHQSRLRRQRSDAAVYGLASGRFTFVLVAVSHEGVLGLSRGFDVLCGDLGVVLGCLGYLLGEDGQQSKLADADDAILIDDNEYMKPPKAPDDDDDDDDDDNSA